MSEAPYSSFLGFEVLERGMGTARLRAAVGEAHLNMHGSAHGGYLYSLADEAFALACNSHPDASAVALNTTMHYFKALGVGDVVEARASETHRGRSTGTYRVELWVGERQVGLFTGTAFRIAREQV